MHKVISVKITTLHCTETDVQSAIHAYISSVDSKVARIFKLRSPEALLADLNDSAKLSVPITIEDVDTLRGTSDGVECNFAAWVTTCRRFLDSLPVDFVLPCFRSKLAPYWSELQEFAYKLTGDDSVWELMGIRDLSSNRSGDRWVYQLGLRSENNTNATIILKASNVVRNEFFGHALTRICGLPSILTQLIGSRTIAMSFIQGITIGKMFEKGVLQTEYSHQFQYYYRQLAAMAACFDITWKGDRTIGITDPTGNFGNYILSRDNVFYAIDHDYIINFSDRFLRLDFHQAFVEATFLLSHDQDHLEENWADFKEAYLETRARIVGKKEVLLKLLIDVFPESEELNQKRYEVVAKNLALSDSEVESWLSLVFEGFPNSMKHIRERMAI